MKVKVAYTNDVYKEGEYDRNFYLHGVSLKKEYLDENYCHRFFAGGFLH